MWQITHNFTAPHTLALVGSSSRTHVDGKRQGARAFLDYSRRQGIDLLPAPCLHCLPTLHTSTPCPTLALSVACQPAHWVYKTLQITSNEFLLSAIAQALLHTLRLQPWSKHTQRPPNYCLHFKLPKLTFPAKIKLFFLL